jgi:hypothetical protein
VPKPLVFISHIGDEADVATLFKDLVTSHFLGLLEVFVSSDGSSIQMGQQWLQSISGALQRCVVEVIVASPFSVPRPWVNFEAGAGWVRGIPVIPLCHSGATPGTLPIPLNMLQAARATDASDLKQVFDVLAAALGATTPSVNFVQFVADVQSFEQKYLYWTKLNEAFRTIFDCDARIVSALLTSPTGVQIDLDDAQINGLQAASAFLNSKGIVDAQFRLAAAYGPGGASFMCRFARGPNFAGTVSDSRFVEPT